jgi:hypothetical protein
MDILNKLVDVMMETRQFTKLSGELKKERVTKLINEEINNSGLNESEKTLLVVLVPDLIETFLYLAKKSNVFKKSCGCLNK